VAVEQGFVWWFRLLAGSPVLIDHAAEDSTDRALSGIPFALLPGALLRCLIAVAEESLVGLGVTLLERSHQRP
jgi:hypothetical protein